MRNPARHPVFLFLLFSLSVALSSCSSAEKYYIRNFSTLPVTVYLRGDKSREVAHRIRLHKESVLHVLALVETPFTLVPVVSSDSSGLYAIVIPPMAAAYVGEKSEKEKDLNGIRFLLADGKEILWLRHESTSSPYIYYFDFK